MMKEHELPYRPHQRQRGRPAPSGPSPNLYTAASELEMKDKLPSK